MASRSKTPTTPTTPAETVADLAPETVRETGEAKRPRPKPELEVVTDQPGSEILSKELRKQELLQLVSERTELRNNKVKPVLEAMLEVLGEAIAEGRELNLSPLGKLKINRQKDVGGARVTVAKIRQALPKEAGEEG